MHYQFVGFAWAFLWVGFALVLFTLNRRERMHIYDLAEKAAAEGRTLQPELMARLRRRFSTWLGDVRLGVVLIAAAFGLMISGIINHYEYGAAHPNAEWFDGGFKLFPVPLLMGVAFLVIGLWRRREEQDR